MCFTGTEEGQAEQHDHGTIDGVLEDHDMQERGDVFEIVDSVGMRFSILNAVCMGTIKHGL